MKIVNKKTICIKDGFIVNEGKTIQADIFIKDGFIEEIAPSIQRKANVTIPASGKYILPGIIDDQVHFREPGLDHKADIASESRAALFGGVTSFMEMPNTNPPTVTQSRLQAKFDRALAVSPVNFSFFMGATNDNIEEVLRTDAQSVCGIKVFMGSSTGNMLVDSEKTLETLFSQVPMLIATHCEDEATIRTNFADYIIRYGDNIPPHCHPEIRNAQACHISSSMAVELAKRHNTRLHILHISTADELALFRNDLPLAQKRITSEVCVHHLYFNSNDYAQLGHKIKCNPAIKSQKDQNALLAALLDDRLDIIATDHAPHTLAEKQQPYTQAPSGLPLVQHSLSVMLDFYHKGMISLEKIVEKMCHAPATCFKIDRRGFLKEGYFADIAIVDLEKEWTIAPRNIKYKCNWSPLEGKKMKGKVETVLVNGHIALKNGKMNDTLSGMRMGFLNYEL
jgi:dihydroorotase